MKSIFYFNIVNLYDQWNIVFNIKKTENKNKQKNETSQLGFICNNMFMSQVGNLLNLY
jgi:hypothetical protein